MEKTTPTPSRQRPCVISSLSHPAVNIFLQILQQIPTLLISIDKNECFSAYGKFSRGLMAGPVLWCVCEQKWDCGQFYLSEREQRLIINYISCQMIDKKGLTATNFIKSAEMREKYQCGICYEVCIKPVRCRGPCGKIFCMKCVSDSRQNHDVCPMKCSAPFLVERIPDIQLEFFCPYNPSQCHSSIDSLRAFDQHYLHCPYVSPEELHQKQMKLQYKCLKGHQLEFFVGSYEEMLGSLCAECGEKRLVRSLCRICQQFYCVGCRVPPCAKQGCPIGHSFTFQSISNLNFICDICGVSTAVSNDVVYDDSLCNFGICEDCFNQLPAKFDQSKPRELIANINTACSCGKPLECVDAMSHMSPCALCTKIRECPKYCSNCQKHYCLYCKAFDINFDSTCSQEHEFESYQVGEMEEEGTGCMRCDKNQKEYFFDAHCKVRLCNECLEYSRNLTSDKQRPIVLKCQNNHVLVYVVGSEDYYDTCQECQQVKIIRLRCMYCSQKGTNFCFQCRPIPLNTCYYKHPLRLAIFQSQRQCHFCLQQTNELYYCKKCYFYVCTHCYAQHPPQNPAEEHEHQGECHKIEKKGSCSTDEKMEDCRPQELDPGQFCQEQQQ